MTFASGSKIADFDTQVDLDNTTAAIAINGFSLASDLNVYTNTANALTAAFVFRCTFGSAPTANSGIVLLAQQLNIDPVDTGVADQPFPSLSYLHDIIASVPVLDSTSIQLNTYGGALLRGVKANQEFQFVIWNRTNQIIPAGWTLLPTPTAEGVEP